MLDQQLSPNTIIKHLSTSFSFHQQLSDMVFYPDELHAAAKSSNSKKDDSLPSLYTEIRKFLSPSTSLTFSIVPISVLPDFDSFIHHQGVKGKESACVDKTCYWVPWHKHHSGKHRLVVRLPDIRANLLPIDERSIP